jgi:alpha-ribazole phosphatase
VDARLSELAFGEWEGRPYAELERDAAFVRWMSDWREAAPPGGERLAELAARVLAWRADVIARSEGLLALTHAGVIRALRALDRGVTYDAVASERVEPLRVESFGGPA